MSRVTFYPEKKEVEVEAGITLLEAARIAAVVIESPCNGVLVCGKCKVRVNINDLKNLELFGSHHLKEEEQRKGYVLACGAKVIGDVSVQVENEKKNNTLKILSKGKSFEIILDTFIKKTYDNKRNITSVYAGEIVTGEELGDTTNKNYGLVVDIGTTTLVASLVDLNSGNEITSVSSLNPQAIHAQDVLSRIKFASDEKGLKIMYSILIDEINSMIDRLSKNTGIVYSNIYEVIFSGNTCMLHLATGVSSESLGKYPYTPKVHGGNHIMAIDLGINISTYGLIYLPSIISAYVGADITSGILASELYKEKGKVLFVDIGTNGEMAISYDGKLSATSTAAGPAFEGMNITHGMRAASGAIEYFDIDDNSNITVKTIEDTEAVGICGSGLLDIIGELVHHKVIDSRGKLVDPSSVNISSSLKDRIIKVENKLVFQITDNIGITQKDIRQVQLAKGAVRAGIEFLLRSKGLGASDIDKVLIAGSFGYHLRAQSLINIGLLPKEFDGKIEFVGNTSKSGGQALLLNRSYRSIMNKTVKQIEVIELSNFKDFDKVFVECLGF